MQPDNLFHRLGDVCSVIVQMCTGNRYPTRYLTRKVSRYYRSFKRTAPDKSDEFIVNMVAAWRMSESTKPENQRRWFALLKDLKENPQTDLNKVTVSMLCIEFGLDEVVVTRLIVSGGK